MSKLDGKWEGMEELNKPNLANWCSALRGDLLALGRLTKEKVTP